MTGAALSTDSRSTYDAASGHFDQPALGFWDRYGQRTVARLGLRPGVRVLDVCCGTGASALHAARAVGPGGSVLGVDISARLLDLAREKASREGVENIEFRIGDMERLELADGGFDAVVIVFGIFFAEDMAARLRALRRLLRPGGVLAVTTWAPGFFEPLYTPFLEAARARLPGVKEYRPWDRLAHPDDVASLLRRAGIERFDVTAEEGREPLRGPEDWWTIVLGTGLRWFVDQMGPAAAPAFREECLARARGVSEIATNVVYAVARD